MVEPFNKDTPKWRQALMYLPDLFYLLVCGKNLDCKYCTFYRGFIVGVVIGIAIGASV